MESHPEEEASAKTLHLSQVMKEQKAAELQEQTYSSAYMQIGKLRGKISKNKKIIHSKLMRYLESSNWLRHRIIQPVIIKATA